MKFAICAVSRNDHESGTIAAFCALNQHSFRVIAAPKDVPTDCIAVGPVNWVTEVLGVPQEPDYYPEFLSSWLHRKVWRAHKWPLGHRVFIKPSDRHKRFTGFVTRGTWKGKKKGPYWCSEVVNFVTEWRWYITAGKVVAARYCCGVEAPVPELDIEWPANFHSAVDFGRLDNGQIALVENNCCFSVGWYGSMSEGKVYAEWLAAGWQHLRSVEVKRRDRTLVDEASD